MSRVTRKYDPKLKALALIHLENGSSARAISERFDIPYDTLRGWRRQQLGGTLNAAVTHEVLSQRAPLSNQLLHMGQAILGSITAEDIAQASVRDRTNAALAMFRASSQMAQDDIDCPVRFGAAMQVLREKLKQADAIRQSRTVDADVN